MSGDLAKAWAAIKAKRAADAAAAAQDIATLKAQIASDSLNDDDRAALAEMQTEAGAA